MAQLHHAAQDGNIPALKVLLEFNLNLDIEVGLLSTHHRTMVIMILIPYT